VVSSLSTARIESKAKAGASNSLQSRMANHNMKSA
jgi:hypothetical protein